MALSTRRQLYLVTFLSGVLSVSSYVLVFTHQEWVTRYFTRGGVYALLPILTAFYFSVVHGTFTSGLLHALGIRVAKKPGAGKVEDRNADECKVQK